MQSNNAVCSSTIEPQSAWNRVKTNAKDLKGHVNRIICTFFSCLSLFTFIFKVHILSTMSTTPTTHLPPHLSEPTTQPALASTVTTHQSKPKSLPPEILHTIFTYLHHGTLRRSVNRVCKQWRLISNHYIHRTATWIPVDPKNKKQKQ